MVVVRTFTGDAVPGWASIMVPLLFIGSMQLLCLGVIGEYLGKLYEEVKRRPRFHLERVVTGSRKAERGKREAATKLGQGDLHVERSQCLRAAGHDVLRHQ